jgi:hypothetical protein
MKKIFTLLFSALSLCSFAGTQVIYDVETVMGDWTTIDEGTLSPSLFNGIEAGNKIVVTASASDGGQVWLAKLEGDSWSEVNLIDGADITTSVSYTLTAEDIAVITERGIRLKGKNFTLASIAIEDGSEPSSETIIYDVETVMGDWTTIDEGTLSPSLFSGIEAGNKIMVTASASDGGQVWLAKLEGDSWSEVNLIDGAEITTSVSYTLTENDITVIAERGIRVKGKNFTLAKISIVKEPTSVNLAPATKAQQDNILYNTSGQKVTDSYKGIVIKNGRKYIK